MDPQSNSNVGQTQAGNDLDQLPAIHGAQAFQAPNTPTHFAVPAENDRPKIDSAIPSSPTASPLTPQLTSQAAASQILDQDMASRPAPANYVGETTAQQLARYNSDLQTASTFQAGPSEDTDTAYDQEMVAKAQAIKAQTQGDPYQQAQLLGKLKAQYIKVRYNKDVKVSEE